MDFFHQCVATILFCVLASPFFFYYLLPWWKNANDHDLAKSRGKPVPEVDGAWPIIGHMHMLQPSDSFYSSLAEKYGPIFTLRIGLCKTIVINSWELAKECCTTHDRVLASSPEATAAKILGYDYAMFGRNPYGPYWREMRKIIITELVSNRRLELLKHIRVTEISTSIQELYQLWETRSSILKKAQEEIDIHVGSDKQVEESDIEKLVYLQAIVKETLRLYSPGLGTREPSEDCTISGFHVPKGTEVMVNVQQIHRDPSIWSNPLEFQPERFLTTQANIDFGGQHHEYIPFGAGRRLCPAISFAVLVVHLTLARLLQGFDFATPKDAPVEMNESVEALEVLITPRLPLHLY